MASDGQGREAEPGDERRRQHHEQGLGAAVESLAAGLPVDVTVESNPDTRAGREVELAAYFIIAEAFTNVVKHAEATSVSVRLHQSREDLRFEVIDDGRGFDPEGSAGSSTGLAGLRDRADSVGGAVTVRSSRRRGTTVSGWLPAATSAELARTEDGGL